MNHTPRSLQGLSRQGASRRQGLFPCQGSQRGMGEPWSEPEGMGPIARMALLVAACLESPSKGGAIRQLPPSPAGYWAQRGAWFIVLEALRACLKSLPFCDSFPRILG